MIVSSHLGYVALALLVMLESSGVPLPGETALITAATLAARHHLKIEVVIVVAAAAAMCGDNIGYVIGRVGGRRLLQAPGPFAKRRAAVLAKGEPFFAKHGPKAVFIGRWVIGLRTWTAWLAGASRMPWNSFAMWNAAGGISWATVIGLIAFHAGRSTAGIIGVFAVGSLSLVIVGARFLWSRRARGRRPATDPSGT
jgi:membrane-associated protein